MCLNVCHPMCCAIPIFTAAGRITFRMIVCPQYGFLPDAARSKRCRTMTALKKLAESLFSSWPFKLIILAGELTKSASLPKHSSVDLCSLIERAGFESHWTKVP